MILGQIANGMPLGQGLQAAALLPAATPAGAFAAILERLVPEVDAPTPVGADARDTAPVEDRDPAQDHARAGGDATDSRPQQFGAPTDVAFPVASGAALPAGQAAEPAGVRSPAHSPEDGMIQAPAAIRPAVTVPAIVTPGQTSNATQPFRKTMGDGATLRSTPLQRVARVDPGFNFPGAAGTGVDGPPMAAEPDRGGRLGGTRVQSVAAAEVLPGTTGPVEKNWPVEPAATARMPVVKGSTQSRPAAAGEAGLGTAAGRTGGWSIAGPPTPSLMLQAVDMQPQMHIAPKITDDHSGGRSGAFAGAIAATPPRTDAPLGGRAVEGGRRALSGLVPDDSMWRTARATRVNSGTQPVGQPVTQSIMQPVTQPHALANPDAVRLNPPVPRSAVLPMDRAVTEVVSTQLPAPHLAQAAGLPAPDHRTGEEDMQRAAVSAGAPSPVVPVSAGPSPGAAVGFAPVAAASLAAGAAPPIQMSAGSSRRAGPEPATPASPGRTSSPLPRPNASAGSAPSIASAAIAASAGKAASEREENIRMMPELSALIAVPGSERPGMLAVATPSASPAAVPSAVPPPAAQIAAAVSALGGGRTEIVLAPEELGRVAVTMGMQDGIMTVVILAERGETTDLIRRNLDQLAQEFRDLGYGDVSFHFGSGPDDDRATAQARDRPGPADPEAPAQPDLPTTGDGAASTNSTKTGRMDLRF